MSDVPRALVGTMQIGPLAYPIYWLFVVGFTVVLMTLLLIAFGRGAPSSSLALACALIVGGAALAGRGLWRRC